MTGRKFKIYFQIYNLLSYMTEISIFLISVLLTKPKRLKRALKKDSALVPKRLSLQNRDKNCKKKQVL